MTRIDFYTHVADKIPVALRLTCKAWAQGMPVWLRVADDDMAAALDRLLWTHPQAEFVPHCLSDHDLAHETPIVIDAREQEPRSHRLLINLRSDHPVYFARFERLAEVVGLADHDVLPARDRYRFYQQRGFPITTHNLSTFRTQNP